MTTSDAFPFLGPTFVESYSTLQSGPSSWVIEGLIPTGGLALLYGAPKTGKSMLALQLALAVTQGHPDFLSFPVTAPGRVLYLQLDTPRSLWRDRITNWEAAGVDFTPWGTLAIEDKESAPFPFNILDARHSDWLRSAVASIEPSVVILDTWRESFRGDENDSSHAQIALASFVSAITPASGLIISHGKKPPEDPSHERGLMDEIRGSSYLPGAVDTIMRLRCKENATVGRFATQGRALPFTSLPLVRGAAGIWSVAKD